MKKYYGPWELGHTGFYFCAKFDWTPVHKFLLSAILSVIHPALPLLFFTGKEISDGTGYRFRGIEQCVGKPGTKPGDFKDYCKQGFDVLDYGAVLLVTVPWWIWLPSLFGVSWVW